MKHVPERYSFSSVKPGFGREDIERMMSYEPGTSPEPFPQLIDELLYETASLLDFRGGWLLHPMDETIPDPWKIRLGATLFSVGKVIYNQLKNAEQVALFQCTSGEAITEYARKEAEKGDSIRSYIADVIGSVAVEVAMDQMQDSLEAVMKESGLRITNRYSPGYCNWDVSEQKLLFSFFPENFVGIRLSESSLMHPIKSVSGIIGIGAKVKKNKYSCGICEMKNCIYIKR